MSKSTSRPEAVGVVVAAFEGEDTAAGEEPDAAASYSRIGEAGSNSFSHHKVRLSQRPNNDTR